MKVLDIPPAFLICFNCIIILIDRQYPKADGTDLSLFLPLSDIENPIANYNKMICSKSFLLDTHRLPIHSDPKQPLPLQRPAASCLRFKNESP